MCQHIKKFCFKKIYGKLVFIENYCSKLLYKHSKLLKLLLISNNYILNSTLPKCPQIGMKYVFTLF